MPILSLNNTLAFIIVCIIQSIMSTAHLMFKYASFNSVIYQLRQHIGIVSSLRNISNNEFGTNNFTLGFPAISQSLISFGLDYLGIFIDNFIFILNIITSRVNIIGSLRNEYQMKPLCLGYTKVQSDLFFLTNYQKKLRLFIRLINS